MMPPDCWVNIFITAASASADTFLFLASLALSNAQAFRLDTRIVQDLRDYFRHHIGFKALMSARID